MQKDISALNEKVGKELPDFIRKADREYEEKIERLIQIG